jgi:hypothetical protein
MDLLRWQTTGSACYELPIGVPASICERVTRSMAASAAASPLHRWMTAGSANAGLLARTAPA